MFRFGIPDVRTLKGGLDLLRYGDLRSLVMGIRCPVLAIFGVKDVLVPSETAAVMELRCPEWQISCLANAGHAPFVSHRKQVWGLLKTFAHANR